MSKNNPNFLTEIAAYYSEKLAAHGQTPLGVDWNEKGSQELRFMQLCKIISLTGDFSINDLGCGYGALNEYMRERYADFSYSGFDISDSMILSAQERHLDRKKTKFFNTDRPLSIADYGVASGIFNVRIGKSNAEWRSYLEKTLDILDVTSRIGFSFNCLTSHSDVEKMRNDLFYVDPCELFDFCRRRYTRNVALLHDYGLYEFTILVRKLV